MDNTQKQLDELTRRLDELTRSDAIPRNVETAFRTRLNIGTSSIVESFKVGGIYISVDSTNPATILGYGTWIAFGEGRTLVGVDTGQTEFDNVEETGGEKTHTLTITEIPAHTHTVMYGGGGGILNTASPGTQNSGTFNTGATGSDGAHNNLQPYITVYFWKRVA